MHLSYCGFSAGFVVLEAFALDSWRFKDRTFLWEGGGM